jgi:membrane protease YdiL (CAAX protease family)
VKAIIRSFSVPTEFCLVIFIGFGITIVGTLAWMMNHFGPAAPASSAMRLTNDGIIEGVVLRMVTLSAVLSIGHVRGWSLATFGLRPSWKWTGAGVLLFLANGLAGQILRLLMTKVFHTTVDFHRVSELTLPFVILICIVNPIFEEALECGYFFQALQRRGMWVTVLASAMFRGFLHATMGVSGFVFMFASGLLFGFFYWRWRQLWPLIVAHALQMLYALLPQALAASQP